MALKDLSMHSSRHSPPISLTFFCHTHTDRHTSCHPIAHSRKQRYFRQTIIISVFNNPVADSQKSILTMQTLNQSLSISLLACVKSMPIQYPAKNGSTYKGMPKTENQSSNTFDSVCFLDLQIREARFICIPCVKILR